MSNIVVSSLNADNLALNGARVFADILIGIWKI